MTETERSLLLVLACLAAAWRSRGVLRWYFLAEFLGTAINELVLTKVSYQSRAYSLAYCLAITPVFLGMFAVAWDLWRNDAGRMIRVGISALLPYSVFLLLLPRHASIYSWISGVEGLLYSTAVVIVWLAAGRWPYNLLSGLWLALGLYSYGYALWWASPFWQRLNFALPAWLVIACFSGIALRSQAAVKTVTVAGLGSPPS
jgi:hypothetical protein